MSLSFSDSANVRFSGTFLFGGIQKIAVSSKVFQLKSSWSCADLGPGTSGELIVVSLFSFSNPTCYQGGNDDDIELYK